MTVREILAAHPRPAGGDRDALVRCIEECADCVVTCTGCADACLAEPDVVDMVRCIRLCLDCADQCIATERIAVRQTEREVATLRGALDACIATCRASAEECAKHAAHHEHCRVCEGVCRSCQAACEALLATL
jgi:hypothetical protein